MRRRDRALRGARARDTELVSALAGAGECDGVRDWRARNLIRAEALRIQAGPRTLV
ncbi:Hypothetical protein A7982_06369 [Minicystis rosea]|nr:Hypothetical protein A7982_06369 [Minicystis rosea]